MACLNEITCDSEIGGAPFVIADEGTINAVILISRIANIFLLSVGAIMLVVSIFIISNTIKLAVYSNKREITFYNEDYSISDLVLHPDGNNIIKNDKADKILKKAVELSRVLSKEFNFVRVDWLINNNKLYFNELTFTPYSGFIKFDKKWNKKLGSWIKIYT